MQHSHKKTSWFPEVPRYGACCRCPVRFITSNQYSFLSVSFPFSQDIVTADWVAIFIKWEIWMEITKQTKPFYYRASFPSTWYDTTSTNPFLPLFHPPGCCLGLVRRYGRTGSGFLKVTAGRTWRTMMAKSFLKHRTCGLLYPSHCSSSYAGRYSRGESFPAGTVFFLLSHCHLPINLPLPFGFACFFLTNVRLCFSLSRFVATPLASLLGVCDKQRVRAPPNPTLESFFCSTSKNPTQVMILHTSGN